MRRWMTVLALGLATGGVAFATDATDKTFADKAAASGVAEVKQFARKMVEDHTKAGVELKQIASKQDLTLPTAMDEKHQKVYDKLVKLSGADFDKA